MKSKQVKKTERDGTIRRQVEIRDMNGLKIGIFQLVQIERENGSTYYGMHIVHNERLDVQVHKMDNVDNYF